MRILVYPHAMEIGGSQLNAIELAGAVRDRGHHVVVYSEDGPLVERVRALGLPWRQAVRARQRPSAARVRDLRTVLRRGGFDIVHGYEWPPILEGWAAAAPLSDTCAVGTVMSMAVADFIPGTVPLAVGTSRIARATRTGRPGAVTVLEPPVDTVLNRPGVAGQPVPVFSMIPATTVTLVVVSRVVKELKLEGILTAIRAVGELATRHDVHLVVVGGGRELDTVMAEAVRINGGLAKPAVTITGEVGDPRGAYDAADICLGMGGSALRALAFAKPVIVQGEGGFFEVLTPDSVGAFLDGGFYGVATRDADAARRHLVALLEPLVTDLGRRSELGAWGRGLITDRYSLVSAAVTQESIYHTATSAVGRALVEESLLSARRFAAYQVGRQWSRLRRRLPTDDFNSRPV